MLLLIKEMEQEKELGHFNKVRNHRKDSLEVHNNWYTYAA